MILHLLRNRFNQMNLMKLTAIQLNCLMNWNFKQIRMP